MPTSKTLTKRQMAVIEDLLAGDLDEQAVLNKHGIKSALFDRWLADEHFTEALGLRIARSYRTGQVILASYATLAASKLTVLTQCDREETARKACLDLITMRSTASKQPPINATQATEKPAESNLSPETASRILAALAESGPRQ